MSDHDERVRRTELLCKQLEDTFVLLQMQADIAQDLGDSESSLLIHGIICRLTLLAAKVCDAIFRDTR